jgi:ATP-binding cassette subfamily F protein uup
LESYLEDFKGVLVVVSHDRSFTDKVTNHLFVFEGKGEVKDYLGSLSDYAECLIEQEKEDDIVASPADAVKNESNKESKEERVARMNSIKKMKKDLNRIEPLIEILKTKATELQSAIDNSAEEGWTVLANLTDNLNKVKEEIQEKELEWLELAEQLEALE